MLAMLFALIHAPALVCPITGATVDDDSPFVCISGIQFRFKDVASRSAFLKAPREALAKAAAKGRIVGVSFFDPVARKSMILSRDGQIREPDISAVKTWSPFGGVLYPLASPRSENAFLRGASRFLQEPAKYSLWCPIMRKSTVSIERSVGYVDQGDTRFYICCESCMAQVSRQKSGPGWDEASAKSMTWSKLHEAK